MKMAAITKQCECCGKSMQVRAADVARGWGRFCSKSCKASAQERHTHQNAVHVHQNSMSQAELAGGGYGDSTKDDAFGDDKW